MSAEAVQMMDPTPVEPPWTEEQYRDWLYECLTEAIEHHGPQALDEFVYRVEDLQNSEGEAYYWSIDANTLEQLEADALGLTRVRWYMQCVVAEVEEPLREAYPVDERPSYHHDFRAPAVYVLNGPTREAELGMELTHDELIELIVTERPRPGRTITEYLAFDHVAQMIESDRDTGHCIAADPVLRRLVDVVLEQVLGCSLYSEWEVF